MFTVKRAISSDGRDYSIITVLPDGSVEGRIYRSRQSQGSAGEECEVWMTEKRDTNEFILDEHLESAAG